MHVSPGALHACCFECSDIRTSRWHCQAFLVDSPAQAALTVPHYLQQMLWMPDADNELCFCPQHMSSAASPSLLQLLNPVVTPRPCIPPGHTAHPAALTGLQVIKNKIRGVNMKGFGYGGEDAYFYSCGP